ncbi:uncharacterized protein FIESC28_05694 [Fusarium coffeatum]|uniref:Uncharacterized protein n=1 Tax=Fusarium coffeatum TaxID=231269 RepID=A0A366RQ54_9HYPO|nr:uncharacterized protein FIESC28_05694 [Fusarium coffeatum]RBR19229.1 hypothetical protein FIESC28_05694 [Fusarium coffeatum]
MMPANFYIRKELEALSSDVPPRDIVRKFLSPGMTFEDVAPAHPYRSQIMTPKFTKDNQSEEDRREAIERARLYNAFADYQSPYGIPVKVKTYHAVNPWDDVSILRVLEEAFVKLCSATTEDHAKHEMIPVLGVEFVRGNRKYHGVYRSTGRRSTWTVSLAGLKEIGLDLESLAATMGDALAMIIYKCGLTYVGSFFFRPMPIDSNEHPGSSTISLYISLVNFEIMDAKFLYPLAMKAMLGYWKLNVPSPNILFYYAWGHP